MANEIVKYHNDFNLEYLKIDGNALRNMTIDLLMVIFYVFKDKGEEPRVIPWAMLENLTGFKQKKMSRKDFMDAVSKEADRILSLRYDNYIEGSGKEFKKFNFFVSCESVDEGLLAQVTANASYILNHVNLNYTAFELAEITSLSSEYSKKAYMELKKYSDTGWWKVSMEKFRKIMDIPESYTNGNVNSRVIGKINKDLSRFFEGLTIEPLTKKVGKTRVITGFYFSWIPEVKYIELKGDEKEDIQICPLCGKPLRKKINRQTGRTFYGHINGDKEDAFCSQTYSDIDEIKRTLEKENERIKMEMMDPIERDIMEDEIRNAEKIRDIYGFEE